MKARPTMCCIRLVFIKTTQQDTNYVHVHNSPPYAFSLPVPILLVDATVKVCVANVAVISTRGVA